MTRTSHSDAELLALEERQLHQFLRDVRPVGEEKSELYAEPTYFHLSYQAMIFCLPEMVREVRTRMTEQELGERTRRVLGRATGLHVSGTPFVAAWAREMWLSLQGGADPASSTIARVGDATVADRDVAEVLRFAYDWGCAYRQDGWAYPSETSGLGGDYRILDEAEAAAIAADVEAVDGDGARDVLALYAAMRALSFLMEAETRDALMMHGPYPVDGDRALVFLECNDLRWSMFPDFPIPGQRWELPDQRFPYPNLSLALVMEGVSFEADRMGTLYASAWSPEKLVAASILTRGDDEWSDGDLETVPVADARELTEALDAIQEHMFLQAATWDVRQRVAAAHFQKGLFMLRVLSGAGIERETLDRHFARYRELTVPIWDEWFDHALELGDQLPFYQRLGAFIGGATPTLFTPYR
jgi:hypothetical protein